MVKLIRTADDLGSQYFLTMRVGLTGFFRINVSFYLFFRIVGDRIITSLSRVV